MGGQALLTRRFLPNLREGDQVCFHIEASDFSGSGVRPRAVDVKHIDDSSPSFPVTSSSPGEGRDFQSRWTPSSVESDGPGDQELLPGNETTITNSSEALM